MERASGDILTFAKRRLYILRTDSSLCFTGSTRVFYLARTTTNDRPNRNHSTVDATPEKTDTMSFFRITLHRSAIGLPKRTQGVLAALGLRRRSQVVFHPVEAQFAGMIMKVKELVKVEEVDRALSKKEVREARRPERGFEVLGNVRRGAAQ